MLSLHCIFGFPHLSKPFKFHGNKADRIALMISKHSKNAVDVYKYRKNRALFYNLLYYIKYMMLTLSIHRAQKMILLLANNTWQTK